MASKRPLWLAALSGALFRIRLACGNDTLCSEGVNQNISDVNDMFFEKPSIDLTHDGMAWSRTFPLEELNKGGSRELENFIECDA